MRELESSLQQFAEFLLKARLVKEPAAPYCVRHVRRFLTRPAADQTIADRVRSFCEDLERAGSQDWQVRQAEHALRLYFVNFLQRTDWHHPPSSPAVDGHRHVTPLAALEQLRQRLRSRHYSSRTEQSYTDWARRFLDYLAKRHRTYIVSERPAALGVLHGVREGGLAILTCRRDALHVVDSGTDDRSEVRPDER